jgi:uncharacterized protein YkwD
MVSGRALRPAHALSEGRVLTRRLSVLSLCIVGAVWITLAQAGAAGAHRRLPARGRTSQSCPYADVPVGSAPLATLRAAALCLTNQERAAHGLPGLRASARLNLVAERQTHAMVASGDFTHGTNFTLRFSTVGYDWRAAGENIATGYSTPRSVVAAWMASTDHCRNILDPTFRDAGTGATTASVGADVSPGTWTEDFGLAMGQSPASRNTRPQNACPY